MQNLTAILIDGTFFLKRFRKISRYQPSDAQSMANEIHKYALKHLNNTHSKESSTSSSTNENTLYRVFFYDCKPLDKKAHNPISGSPIDFSKTNLAQYRLSLFEHLKTKRKVALRLGYIYSNNNWVLKNPDKNKKLLRNEISPNDLGEEDVIYDMKQKGIDIKIGVDITSMAIKKQVNKIVLVSGDADFVPASKLARREGIDFILDPMWSKINDDLFEHIDGLHTPIPKPA